MTNNDTVLELYNRGISAHDLRSSYVDDLVGDNHYLRLSRQEIAREKSFIKRMGSTDRIEQEFRLLDLVLFALEEAEPKAVNALLSGQVIGLGLTDAQNLSPKIVAPLQWPFLTMDFEKGSASGAGLNYVGLRFLFRDELNEDQVQILEATSKSTAGRRSGVTQIRSLSDLNISTWENLRLRFLKDKFIEVGGLEKSMRCSLAGMSLLDRTTRQENKACVALLQMANGVTVTTNEKHTVSNLRRLLKNQFGLSGDPFRIEKVRGYLPRFQLMDARDALDRRAKEKAIHQPFNDEQQADKQSPDRGAQDGYSYEEDWEMQGDETSAWLNKEMSG